MPGGCRNRMRHHLPLSPGPWPGSTLSTSSGYQSSDSHESPPGTTSGTLRGLLTAQDPDPQKSDFLLREAGSK